METITFLQFETVATFIQQNPLVVVIVLSLLMFLTIVGLGAIVLGGYGGWRITKGIKGWWSSKGVVNATFGVGLVLAILVSLCLALAFLPFIDPTLTGIASLDKVQEAVASYSGQTDAFGIPIGLTIYDMLSISVGGDGEPRNLSFKQTLPDTAVSFFFFLVALIVILFSWVFWNYYQRPEVKRKRGDIRKDVLQSVRNFYFAYCVIVILSALFIYFAINGHLVINSSIEVANPMVDYRNEEGWNWNYEDPNFILTYGMSIDQVDQQMLSTYNAYLPKTNITYTSEQLRAETIVLKFLDDNFGIKTGSAGPGLMTDTKIKQYEWDLRSELTPAARSMMTWTGEYTSSVGAEIPYTREVVPSWEVWIERSGAITFVVLVIIISVMIGLFFSIRDIRIPLAINISLLATIIFVGLLYAGMIQNLFQIDPVNPVTGTVTTIVPSGLAVVAIQLVVLLIAGFFFLFSSHMLLTTLFAGTIITTLHFFGVIFPAEGRTPGWLSKLATDSLVKNVENATKEINRTVSRADRAIRSGFSAADLDIMRGLTGTGKHKRRPTTRTRKHKRRK